MEWCMKFHLSISSSRRRPVCILVVKLVVFLALVTGGYLVLAQRDSLWRIEPGGIELTRAAVHSGADIFFLGDSTLFWGSRVDAARRSTPELLERAAGRAVAEASGAGYHPLVFAAMLEYMRDSGARPEVIILPVNLRAFSPLWDLSPDTQFVRFRSYLAYDSHLFRLALPALMAWKVIDVAPIPDEKYVRRIRGQLLKAIGEAPPLPGVNAPYWAYLARLDPAQWVAASYLYPIQAGDRQARALVRCARIAREWGAPLVLYCTPVNMDLGDELLGGQFTRQVRANRRLLEALARGAGAYWLDLSEGLDGACFMEGHKNAHLHDEGRLYVAIRLAEFLRKSGLMPPP